MGKISFNGMLSMVRSQAIIRRLTAQEESIVEAGEMIKKLREAAKEDKKEIERLREVIRTMPVEENAEANKRARGLKI